MADNEKLVEKVAREIVKQHGVEARQILRARRGSGFIGDELAAQTWRDIAAAAERILREAAVIGCSEPTAEIEK